MRPSSLLPLLLVLLLAACASSSNKAPVEERKAPPRAARPASAPAPVASAPVVEPKPVAAAAESGRSDFYTVKPGDTLMRIGLDTGQNWREIARWNGIDKPNLIEVGQVLRVVPPPAEAAAVAARGVAPSRIETRPLDGKSAAAPASAPPGTATAASSPASGSPATASAPAAAPADEVIVWLWPAAGPVVTPFDETRSKGLAIAGNAGDPVVAAADGRVVYAGSGLRGYGNLVIIKHDATYLTAYAHNQVLLVKEDQTVQRGQRIAEMGSTDADRVQLHFEIRRLGKPTDPAKLLPPR